MGYLSMGKGEEVEKDPYRAELTAIQTNYVQCGYRVNHMWVRRLYKLSMRAICRGFHIWFCVGYIRTVKRRQRAIYHGFHIVFSWGYEGSAFQSQNSKKIYGLFQLQFDTFSRVVNCTLWKLCFFSVIVRHIVTCSGLCTLEILGFSRYNQSPVRVS